MGCQKVYAMRLCLVRIIIKIPREAVPQCEVVSSRGCAGYLHYPLPIP